MKQFAYIRVSTGKQTYARQEYMLKEYFERMGISPDNVTFVTEKITSKTKFAERAIYPTLRDAQPGDVVYACQLDRFGRSMMDILELVNYATNKGVTLMAIDSNMTLENKSPMGKLVLGVLSAMAETERELRAERCQAGIDAAKEEIAKNGYRIARVSGNIQTHMGQQKGCDTSIAREAAYRALHERKILNRENSVAFKWVREKLLSGWRRVKIIEEFNRLHELQPDVFCTPKGKKLSPGILSYWISDGGLTETFAVEPN